MLWVQIMNDTGSALYPLVGFDNCAVCCTSCAPRVVMQLILSCITRVEAHCNVVLQSLNI